MQELMAIVPSLGPSNQASTATTNLILMLLFLLPLHLLIISILKLKSPDNNLSWFTKLLVRFSIPISILCVALVTGYGSQRYEFQSFTGDILNTLAGVMLLVGSIAYIYALFKRKY